MQIWTMAGSLADGKTIFAGPAAELEPLLAKLKVEEVFVRELDTLGIAYHSPGLRAYAEDLAAGHSSLTCCMTRLQAAAVGKL